MPNLTNRSRYNDLFTQRSELLTQAENALNAQKTEEYSSAMAQIEAMNTEMRSLQLAIAKEEHSAPRMPEAGAPNPEEVEALADALRNKQSVPIALGDVMRAFRSPSNAITVASGELVQPIAGGSTIRDAFEQPNSILNQVNVIDLSGTGGINEPYAVEELSAAAGTIAATAGTLRPDSTPSFRQAAIRPYEVSVTAYVDRNINELSPANYYAKIYSMALTALRKKVAELIQVGDGQATPMMFGMRNAKNTVSEAIYSELAVTAGSITADTLMNLYFAYGGDESLSGGARLLLTKEDLAAIGALRGSVDNKRIFEITPDAGNLNTGVIKDGGYIVPYNISSVLTSLSKASAGSAAIPTMIYGNMFAYELGLFSNYSVRVSEDYRAGERMLTILGDVKVGGNLTVNKSMVVATVPAQP